MASSSDEFVTVHHRKKGYKKGGNGRRKNQDVGCLESAAEVDAQVITERLRLSRVTLTESDFARRDLLNTLAAASLVYAVADDNNDSKRSESSNALKRVQQLVCYGLGNFSECPIARHQLALIGWLRDIFDLSESSCWLYDPRFTLNERLFLASLGYKVIEMNEEGKRKSVVPTLYYMPHCDRPLYNNLLWANWSPPELERTIILGNSFTSMTDTGRCYEASNPPPRVGHKPENVTEDLQRSSEDSCSYVRRVLRYTREYACSNSFVRNDVFNDMALHVFTSEGGRGVVTGGDQVNKDEVISTEWPELDSSFFTVNNEPLYTDDVEIITTALSNI